MNTTSFPSLLTGWFAIATAIVFAQGACGGDGFTPAESGGAGGADASTDQSATGGAAGETGNGGGAGTVATGGKAGSSGSSTGGAGGTGGGGATGGTAGMAASGGDGGSSAGGSAGSGNGGGGGACVPDDSIFCVSNGFNCGMGTGKDNCGTVKTMDCGGCPCGRKCDSGNTCATSCASGWGANAPCTCNAECCDGLCDFNAGYCLLGNGKSCDPGTNQCGSNASCWSGFCNNGQCWNGSPPCADGG